MTRSSAHDAWWMSLIRSWMPRSAFWWFGVVVWAGVLWSLSANSALPSGPSFPFKDKILHSLYFCGGGVCFLLALFGRSAVRPSTSVLAMSSVLFTAIIGALDEYHQTFTPGRSGNDPWDWLADVSGGLFAACLIRWLLRRAQPQPGAN